MKRKTKGVVLLKAKCDCGRRAVAFIDTVPYCDKHLYEYKRRLLSFITTGPDNASQTRLTLLILKRLCLEASLISGIVNISVSKASWAYGGKAKIIIVHMENTVIFFIFRRPWLVYRMLK